MGGGNFVVPVQAVTDFLENKLSGNNHLYSVLHLSNLKLTFILILVTSLPPSSYRLGVQASNLHEIFPSYITQALQHAILNIDKEVFPLLLSFDY